MKTPPFSLAARLEAGELLRRLQRGEHLSLPRSRRMPSIGPRCHELGIVDRGISRRIVYRTDPDAIIVADVFAKKARTTSAGAIVASRRRLRGYDQATR